MKTFITLALALAACVSAHTTVYGLWVNDVFQGDGRNLYVRSPPSNSPVKDVSLTAINCNVDNRQVTKSVSVKSGDKLTFEWYHDK
jgi:cellulase